MTDHGILGCASVPSRPEKRLMLAVLEGAVGDFQKYATAASGRGRRLFAEADAWLHATDADRPFDFENVCHALDLDPASVRDGLRRWRMARQSHHALAATTRIPVALRRVGGSRHRIGPIVHGGAYVRLEHAVRGRSPSARRATLAPKGKTRGKPPSIRSSLPCDGARERPGS